MDYQDSIETEEQLNELLAVPSSGVIEMMKRLDGDIMILGIGGKMGVSLGMQAVNAIHRAGVEKEVYGVSRFSDQHARKLLEARGIKTIACDLLDRDQVNQLPQVKNIIFMAGRKFGTEGSEALTWAMNVLTPAYVAQHFASSRMVAFSTGCVYPLRTVQQGGCLESDSPEPVGEYSQSCLGRERIFQHFSEQFGSKLLLLRLNYAVDLRYGVLHDIGRAIWEGRPVDNSVGHFNVIWQGDANAVALQSLELADCPYQVLNVTGPETASVVQTALLMGRLMGKEVSFRTEPGDLNYLNCSGKMCRLFGYPRISLEELIHQQAAWIVRGGKSLGKPTHFEVNNGRF